MVLSLQWFSVLPVESSSVVTSSVQLEAITVALSTSRSHRHRVPQLHSPGGHLPAATVCVPQSSVTAGKVPTELKLQLHHIL